MLKSELQEINERLDKQYIEACNNERIANQRLKEITTQKKSTEEVNKSLNKSLDDIRLICNTFLDIEYPLKDAEVKNAFYNDVIQIREDNKFTRFVNVLLDRAEKIS